jgi:hypothetical protein
MKKLLCGKYTILWKKNGPGGKSNHVNCGEENDLNLKMG